MTSTITRNEDARSHGTPGILVWPGGGAAARTGTGAAATVAYLCRALGLLAVGGDWRDRSYGLTSTGQATALAALRARATGPRTIPWP